MSGAQPSPLLRALLRDVMPAHESPACETVQVDKPASQVDKSVSNSSPVDKIPSNSDSVVTALPQPAAPVKPMKSYADQITDLIAARPGIVNAEIADELRLFPGDIRPMIQPRIENSRIIVDKIQGPAGLINAYRINPKWKPSDAKFKPIKTSPDEPLKHRKTPPAAKPVGRPRKSPASGKAKASASDSTPSAATNNALGWKLPEDAVASPAPAASGDDNPKIPPPADSETPRAAVVSEDLQQKAPQNIPKNIPPSCDLGAGDDCTVFACAVYDNGALRIEHAGGVLVLTPEQTSRAVAHLSRFYPEIKS